MCLFLPGLLFKHGALFYTRRSQGFRPDLFACSSFAGARATFYCNRVPFGCCVFRARVSKYNKPRKRWLTFGRILSLKNASVPARFGTVDRWPRANKENNSAVPPVDVPFVDLRKWLGHDEKWEPIGNDIVARALTHAMRSRKKHPPDSLSVPANEALVSLPAVSSVF